MNSSAPILRTKWLIFFSVSIPAVTLLYMYINNSLKGHRQRRKRGEVDRKINRYGSGNISSNNVSPSFYELTVAEDGHADGVTAANFSTMLGLEQPLVIVMVGLPARGKSYIGKLMIRYLKWIGFESKVFNVGDYRRQIGHQSANSNFFDTTNADSSRLREDMAMAVQDNMYRWLHDAKDYTSRVAIFDATNTTRGRRLALIKRAKEEEVQILFVESICDNDKTLERNYALKLQNDDYKGMDPEKAKQDFLKRVRAYEKVYETIEDDEDSGCISYLKLVNVGQKVITMNCHGYLPSQVAFYLQNIHIMPRRIYLSVNAEAIERSNRIAGLESGSLTDEGEEYINNLASFIYNEQETDILGTGKEILVITGTGKIHHKCVQPLVDKGIRCCYTSILHELRGGQFHGMTKQQIEEKYPEEHEKRVKDKLNYRYPGVGGESYIDVIERVRPVIIELERQRRSIVVVCHIAVLRCIYAYFMGVPLPEIPVKDFLQHHIYELSPGPFGCVCRVINPQF